MKKLHLTGAFAVLVLFTVGCSTTNKDKDCSIKAGMTVSFYERMTWYSQKSLAKRPIAQELAKDNIELFLFPKVAQKDLAQVLMQYNTLWLILEHEAMSSYDPDVVGKALRHYVEQGGGLVINHSPGRYPEAPVDPYWDKVFKHLDMERLHEEVVDHPNRKPVGLGKRNAFFTDNFAKHPVTDGVAGLWLLCRDSAAGCGSQAIKYSDDWDIVVRGPKTAKSYPKDKDTNHINYGKVGFYKSAPPIVAARTLGKGRIVSIAVHKDNSGWNYKTDGWLNTLDRGTMNGHPSDIVKVLENALRWTGEPSLGNPIFTKNLKPWEPKRPKYQKNAEFGGESAPVFGKIGNPPRKAGANGIIGAHSNYSDGKNTVKEYVDAAKKAGLNFIIFTDPLELMSKEEIEMLRKDCASVSNDKFYACPGVEYIDSSGLRWVLFHDRIAYPTKEIVIDGKNKYQVFDGKIVLQRNAYGGHQNLYRGAIIDYSALKKAGNDPVNLVYFNGVIPKAYEVDKEIADNRDAMLKTAANVHRYAPFSFTRIRKAEDVAKAAKASQTHAYSLESIRKSVNGKGWGTNDTAVRGNLWVSLGDGPQIERFVFQPIKGTQLIQGVFTVSSPNGIKDVTIYDAHSRIFRRFSGNGSRSRDSQKAATPQAIEKTQHTTEKKDASNNQRLSKEFVIPFDRQSYPQLIVTDMKGNEAVSTNQWLYHYHAGLFRCGDNSNMLSQNPNIIYFPNWDCSLAPLSKKLHTPDPGLSQGHVSEQGGFGYSEPSKLPNQRVISKNHIPIAMPDGKRIDFPNRHKVPSCRSVFPLIEPGVVTIIDQYIGDQAQERSYTEKIATYANCSIQRKVGENPWYRRKHRIYQLVDRIDTWWTAVHKQIVPQYEGGYTVVEGEIKFLKDVKLQDAIQLAELRAANPGNAVEIITPEKTIKPNEKQYSGKLGDKGFISLVSNPEAYYAFFPLKGTDSLSWKAVGKADSMTLYLQLGEKDEQIKAGTVLKYLFAVGSFIKPPQNGKYLKWFADIINPQKAKAGFPVVMRQGTIKSGVGFLTLKADKYAVDLTLGPQKFIQDLPIRVEGLQDNGVAMKYSSLNKKFVPIAFDDANKLAYTSAPMEEADKLWIGNVFVANNPNIRMTLVPPMKNLSKGFLEIHNPTDKEINAKITSSKGAPAYGGKAFSLKIPAGATVRKPLVFP